MEIETEPFSETTKRRRRGGFGFNIAARRLHEIERIIDLRHGGACATSEAEAYFSIAVHSIVPRELDHAGGRQDAVGFGLVVAGVTSWCEAWVPGLARSKMVETIEAAIAEPLWFRADTAAKIIRLTMAERMAAGIMTIGAIDADAEERARLRKVRHAQRARERRAADRDARGGRTRTEFEAKGVSALCRCLGISRATFYRRKRAAEHATP